MQELIIEFNTKKQLKTLLIAIVLLMGSLGFLYHILFISEKIKIFYLGIFLVLAIAAVWMIFAQIKVMLAKDKTAIILNQNGILSKVTPNGKKIGFIPWEDVSELRKVNAHRSEFVAIVTSQKEKYLAKLKSPIEKKSLLEENIVLYISADAVDVSFEELSQLITKYFNASK